MDIAIYNEITVDKMPKQFKLYRYPLKDKLIIPYVILELKSGRVSVDAVRARNEVAHKLRLAYPYCSYIFIAENTTKQKITFYRHGHNFSKFFIFNDFLELEDKKVIGQFIRNHLNEIKNLIRLQ